MEHNKTITIRLSKELRDKITFLRLKYPELFRSDSQVLRSAVNTLYDFHKRRNGIIGRDKKGRD